MSEKNEYEIKSPHVKSVLAMIEKDQSFNFRKQVEQKFCELLNLTRGNNQAAEISTMALGLVTSELQHTVESVDAPSITCPKCKRVSWSAKDVEQKYCGVCGYHVDLGVEAMALSEEINQQNKTPSLAYFLNEAEGLVALTVDEKLITTWPYDEEHGGHAAAGEEFARIFMAGYEYDKRVHDEVEGVRLVAKTNNTGVDDDIPKDRSH